MDRSVLESDPHRVLEGMAIAGLCRRRDQGYIYVRAEYPLAIKRLQDRDHARPNALGLLGDNIFGTHAQLPFRHRGSAPARLSAAKKRP